VLSNHQLHGGVTGVKKILVAGIDVGAATAKAVILEDGNIVGQGVRPTGYDVLRAGESVLDEGQSRVIIERESYADLVAKHHKLHG
jgi:activator of 2-hydroxyglutaryl-CoA dehydratase